MAKLCLLFISFLVVLWPIEPARTAFIPHGGDGEISLFNTHSGEYEVIKYKNSADSYIQEGINELNRMLRCRLTGATTDMSLQLIELVDNIEDHFGGARVDVISGYRSPALNAGLRAKGRRVAANSLHKFGFAMDIRIPGVPLSAIREYAASLKAGGVGYYSGQFVHVDVGPVRYW